MMVLSSKALARCAAVMSTATLLTAGFVLPAGATTPSLPPSTPAVQQTPAPASPSPVASEVSAPSPSAPQPTESASQVPTPAGTEPPAPPSPTAQPVTPAPGAAGNTGPTSPTTSPATGAKAEGEPYAPIGAIGAKWQQLGGSTGALGDPTSNESCDQSGHCVETFAGGEIHYTPTTGANAVIFTSGKTGSEWNKRGGLAALGYPITDEKCDTAGCLQRFSQGIDLTWSAAGGYQQVSTHGAIGDAVYRLYGGYAVTGYPTSAEICTLKNQGCFQDFGKLKLMWSAASGAFGIWAPGAIGGLYNGSSAEQGWLGFPLSKETCGLKAGGCYQLYQGGTIMWSPAVGAHTVHGDIRRDWANHGYENGVLGYPVSEEICESTKPGCRQEYQGGTSYWSPSTGAKTVIGGIRSRYVEQGGAGGYLGYPLDNEVCGQPGGGCYQWFQGGLIFWSPATGAQPVRGGIKAKYEAMGWHWGSLGYPASPEVCSAGECVQTFRGGYIRWTPSSTTYYGRSECSLLNEGGVKYPSADAQHVLLTFAADYGQSYATVVYCQRAAGTYLLDWRTDGRVGASGFKPPGVPSGPTRYNYSPTGSYSVTEAFGLGNPGTALPYRLLNPNSRWGGNPWTDTYNKYFESSSWVGWDENMWYFATGRSHDYRQGAVINYNRPPDSPIVQDAGFAIFLHEHKVATAGCISLDDWAVEDYLRKSVPGDRIIMGVARDIFS